MILNHKFSLSVLSSDSVCNYTWVLSVHCTCNVEGNGRHKPYFRYVLRALKDCEFCEWIVCEWIVCEWIVVRKTLFACETQNFKFEKLLYTDPIIMKSHYLLMSKTYQKYNMRATFRKVTKNRNLACEHDGGM